MRCGNRAASIALEYRSWQIVQLPLFRRGNFICVSQIGNCASTRAFLPKGDYPQSQPSDQSSSEWEVTYTITSVLYHPYPFKGSTYPRILEVFKYAFPSLSEMVLLILIFSYCDRESRQPRDIERFVEPDWN